ncbi:MAG: hypothetical protein OHK0046_33150 [Anaerolineae bacterium]
MYDFDDAAFWLEPDFVLADLVATLINGLELPIGVTLFMKGMVISGVLTSEREYLQSLTDTFNKIIRDENDPATDNLFDFNMLAESSGLPVPPDEADEEEDEDDYYEPPAPVRHLHLKDILILGAETSMTFNASTMRILRIRLTAIDGWILGQATNINPEEANGIPPILH